ncbi:hypothetical protein GLAREA_06545 [Glarea lozoyensis ATCC 20868]|uniref:Uncharacterized protein n=1 Tax=Glarea lozoyensis (strain ATCC 20868 / MF5171) TaxID=1116229 RepID=S3D4Z9_GLAL2|nr:uncharacterized protein GLAREA_06545 [Glarea lozoyensis ATCC 20868]EPE33532.1 hypothetical protein GLAREA_06545 [Glarea lozoyensis ATCC 20868]
MRQRWVAEKAVWEIYCTGNIKPFEEVWIPADLANNQINSSLSLTGHVSGVAASDQNTCSEDSEIETDDSFSDCLDMPSPDSSDSQSTIASNAWDFRDWQVEPRFRYRSPVLEGWVGHLYLEPTYTDQLPSPFNDLVTPDQLVDNRISLDQTTVGLFTPDLGPDSSNENFRFHGLYDDDSVSTVSEPDMDSLRDGEEDV